MIAGRVSVVMLTHSKAELLSGVVESILAQDYDDIELIIVVNGHHQDILNVLCKYESKIQIKINDRNLGFAKGMNQGVETATGEYIYITANDICLTSNYISKLVSAYKESQGWGLLGGVMYNYYSQDEVVGAGGTIEFTPWAIIRESRTIVDPLNTYDIGWIAGASIFTKAAVWRHLGGYREQFFFYCEDVELALRVRRSGGFVRLVPTAKLYHHEHDRSVSLTVEYYKLRNYAAINVLYGPPLTLPLFIPKFFLGLARGLAVKRRSIRLYFRVLVSVLWLLPGWLLERAIRRRPLPMPETVTTIMD